MKQRTFIAGLLFSVVPTMGFADVDFQFPQTVVLTAERTEALAEYSFPSGSFDNGAVPTHPALGGKQVQVWQYPNTAKSSAEIFAGLRAQLASAGYSVIFECETLTCGGFDFRFGIEVVEAPDMHVDLGNFWFLTAKSGGVASDEYLSLLVSRGADTGFAQITSVGEREAVVETATISTKASDATDVAPGDISSLLLDHGAAVLEGLEFATGATELSEDSQGQLGALAAFLSETPSHKVVLVGHTDAQGSLESNIALSKKRAESVMGRLINDYGVPVDQVSAEGIGFLAPRAPNTTAEGRSQNRRVEVILTPTL